MTKGTVGKKREYLPMRGGEMECVPRAGKIECGPCNKFRLL